MDNDMFRFSARFGGISRYLLIPVDNVVAIYARENGQGMAFEASNNHEALTAMEEADADASSAAPTLTAVPLGQNTPDDDGDDTEVSPTPPQKGGRPTLTRIK